MSNIFALWAIGITALAAIALFLYFAFREPWKDWTADRKIGAVTAFVVAVLIFIAVLTTMVPGAIEPLSWHTALRLILFLILTLLPGAIFYLFLLARSASLLNAFVANLDRLGLLGWRVTSREGTNYAGSRPPEAPGVRVETEASRTHRIASYFERFQITTGELPPDFVDSIIKEPRSFPAKPSEQKMLPSPFGSYFLPVYVATVLCALGWLNTLPFFAFLNPKPVPIDAWWAQINTVSAAFMGAYLIAIQILVWRFMRKDLGPNAYVTFSHRMIAAAIAAWVLPTIFTAASDVVTAAAGTTGVTAASITAVSTGNSLLLTAFVIGGFPIVLWRMAATTFKKVFVTAGDSELNLQQLLPVSDLDGLNMWHQMRLEEEDIDTAHTMATTDLVDLLINTRFPSHRLMEWVDQSILLSRIGGPTRAVTALRRDALARYGIVNATSLFRAVQTQHIPKETRIVIDKEEIKAEDGKTIKETKEISINLLTWLDVIGDAIQTNPTIGLIQNWKNIHDRNVTVPGAV